LASLGSLLGIPAPQQVAVHLLLIGSARVKSAAGGRRPATLPLRATRRFSAMSVKSSLLGAAGSAAGSPSGGYRVKVLYSYTAESPDEVSIFEGDTVKVLKVHARLVLCRRDRCA
jgi:hypothetical protein